MSEPGAEVTVDGQNIGISPLADPIFVAPGSHAISAARDERRGSVVVVAEAGGAHPATIALSAAGITMPPTPPVEEHPAGMSWVPGAVVGGAGLVALGIGSGLFIAASGASEDGQAIRDELEAEGVSCSSVASDSRCADGKAADDSHDSLQLGGGILIGVGAATVATGGVLLILAAMDDAPTTSGSAVRVQPVVAPSLGGLVVSGTF